MRQVAEHDRPEDCWMAIDSGVYDLTPYLPQHPTNPRVISAWCGKEASHAFATKGSNRPHSAYAHALLEKYRIGVLSSANPSD